MITLCNIKPEATAANIRNEVMEDALKDYKNDEELWRDINLELGGDKNLDRMIQRAKQKKVGKKLKNRDEVDAKAFFEASGGRDIIIIDSDENLPDKLKEYEQTR